MMADNRNKIDFIFIPIPLWVTYSGLPEKIGTVAWTVFRRLLELRYRFNSNIFFYPLDSLRLTCGLKSNRGLRKILAALANEEGLIRYTSGRGRGNATEFEIIEPLRTPLSEDEVYVKHPRLSSSSFRDKYPPDNPKKGNHVPLLRDKKGEQYSPFNKTKGEPRSSFKKEKGNHMTLLEAKKGNHVPPNKKDCKKDNNKSDLYPENAEKNPVVVLLDRLKKLRLSRKLIVDYIEKYPSAYLEEKIEIIEFRMSKDKRIKNSGGMLRRAIEEDWQPPEALAASKEKRRLEIAKRKRIQAEEKQAAIEEAKNRAVEEWLADAPGELVAEIQARANREIQEENPGTSAKFLRMLNKIRARDIIAREYLDETEVISHEGSI